ncbi:MAG: cadherin-like beta sandwich domain-containing protein [Lachnospiraceae bacterium]|nr:cadherin-like beta sandwich domain-containing protein [Lachnospiraceae bacterium]
MFHFRINKFIIGYVLMLAFIAAVIGAKPAKADGETASISVSSATVEVGQDVTITVSFSASCDAGASIYMTFDASKLSYVSGPTNDSSVSGNTIHIVSEGGQSKTFTFVFHTLAVAEGGTALTITNAQILSIATMNAITPGISNGTVKINPPYQASNNANLASLSIGEAKISPAFSADVTAYTASVGGTVSKVTVSAQPADGKAKVAVSGNTGLKEGNNTVTVKVTAEDGTTAKTYTITVTRAKPPTPKPATPTPTPTPAVQIKVDDQELALKDKPDLKWMENTDEWDSTIVEYKKYKIGALVNKNTDITVVELSDGNLYILDLERDTATRYFAFESAKQTIVIQEVTDEVTIPMGYTKTTRSIDGADVTAYVTSDKSEYALVYARNDKGFTGWFQYDMTNGTFQRFNTEDAELNPTPTPTPTPVPTDTPIPTLTPTEEPLPTVPETTATSSSSGGKTVLEKILLGTTGGLFVLMLVFLVLFLVWKGKYNRRFAPDEDYEDEDEDYL